MIRHAPYAKCERCGHVNPVEVRADVVTGEFFCTPPQWFWCDQRAWESGIAAIAARSRP